MQKFHCHELVSGQNFYHVVDTFNIQQLHSIYQEPLKPTCKRRKGNRTLHTETIPTADRRGRDELASLDCRKEEPTGQRSS